MSGAIEIVSFRMPEKDYKEWKAQPRDLIGWMVRIDFLGHPITGIVREMKQYEDEHLGPGLWVTILPVG